MSKLDIDKKAIRDLAEIMNETGLGEIEIETEDHRLRVSMTTSVAAPAPVMQAAVSSAPGATPAVSDSAASSAPDAGSHPGAVKSPMVGTAYLSPEPSAPAFIKAGDMIEEGQTLLIVEAMKTMNPIAAPKGGKVLEILVSDKQPVEFGQPLVIVE